MSDYASESGHWYTRDGQPMYTIRGKNGEMRPTTLRDARKLNLVPSVTTIMKLMAAPALEHWKTEQVLLSALTLPRYEGEDEKAWLSRVYGDSKEEGAMAADRGTEVHTAIEKSLVGAPTDPEFTPFADAALTALRTTFPGVEWESERSFASPLGYGGKVDLHAKIGLVVDFKSKPGDRIADVKCYDEHFMQAAAYAHGLGMPEANCANIFVTRTPPARAIIIQHDQADTIRGWRMFKALLELFKAKTGLEV